MDIFDTVAPQAMSHEIGALIAAIPGDDFYMKLFAFIARHLPFDSGHVIQYDAEGAPTVLHDGRPNRYEPLDEYISGYFLLDPLWAKIESGNLPEKTYHLRKVAPDSFLRSSYYKEHYGKAEIVDEIGWIISQSAKIQIIVCLMRRWDSSRFSKSNLDFMRLSHPIVENVLKLHQSIKQQRVDHMTARMTGTKQGSPSDHINRRLKLSGMDGNLLSDRQSEVVNLILKGHSTESIGLMLAISPGTVKTHKKDIYSKLGISSHGELFKLFVDAMQAR